MTARTTDVAIVGAGILGLAHAYEAARRGYRVTVFDRSPQPVGASIQNFGTIWLVGLSEGDDYQRALYGRDTWLAVAQEAGIWHRASGSLHLAYSADELAVLQEYQETLGQSRGTSTLLGPAEALAKSPGVRREGLLGALWSTTELTIFSPSAVPRLVQWLAERYGVAFHFQTAVTRIDQSLLHSGAGVWQAERTFVCCGTDFETLFPHEYATSGITRCKLQMLRTIPQPDNWQLGPILCGGLTLLHYDAFRQCPTLPLLTARLAAEYPEYLQAHIHVLVAQAPTGELTIGDSHEYGQVVEPFDREAINALILRYLERFAHVPTLQIATRWHGIYPKIEGRQHWRVSPQPGVTLVSVFGLGMTLSFGLARESLES